MDPRGTEWLAQMRQRNITDNTKIAVSKDGGEAVDSDDIVTRKYIELQQYSSD